MVLFYLSAILRQNAHNKSIYITVVGITQLSVIYVKIDINLYNFKINIF